MTHPPGGFRKYPRTMHKWQDQTFTVRSDEERDAAIEAGWSWDPVQEAPVAQPVAPDSPAGEPEPPLAAPVKAEPLAAIQESPEPAVHVKKRWKA